MCEIMNMNIPAINIYDIPVGAVSSYKIKNIIFDHREWTKWTKCVKTISSFNGTINGTICAKKQQQTNNIYHWKKKCNTKCNISDLTKSGL